MLRKLAVAVGAALIVATAASGQSAPPPDRTSGLLGKALSEGRRGDWAQAAATAEAAGEVAAALVEWHRLRAEPPDWRAAAAFAAAHPGWPGEAQLRVQAEASLIGSAGPDEVLAHFAGAAPATGQGVLALVTSLAALGEAEAAEAAAVRAWRELEMPASIEETLLMMHGAALAQHHWERLDNLLWRGRGVAALRQAARMSPGHEALAEARLSLRARDEGVNARIAAVPAALAGDPGLAFERFDWRMSRRLHESAAELLIERTEAGTLGQPEAWARGRTFLARQALAAGDAALAYRLAAGHGLDDGAAFADLEWFAGFVALRFLDDAEAALRHFQRLRVRVGSPISLGRAGYWEGRAHEALGDPVNAAAAYAFGAEHQTSFYGLLAAERAGLPMDPALAGAAPSGDWRESGITGHPLVQAALMLRGAGEWHSARRFVMHLAETLEPEALEHLGDMLLDLDEPNWAVNIAKIAVQREIVPMRAYFPVTWLAEMELPVPADLALAIARRESEFDPAVVSHADARGLMQVLPSTGRLVAARLGLDFEEGRLLSDPRFNAVLGAGYLAQLFEQFGNAPVLVAAGYNAGPGRPRGWIAELGDPRDDAVDVVDWIERVPFAETRNYIMRVMESVYVYRARLAGGPVEIRLTEELRGR